MPINRKINASNEQSENSFLSRVFITFGRVPLFYFVLQMFVAHIFGILLSLLAGKSIGFYLRKYLSCA
ncbi:MAG TPA: hypothetical protein VGB02_10755 [Pyrinomonadaceae bacterium]|jgi:hypothetical protein